MLSRVCRTAARRTPALRALALRAATAAPGRALHFVPARTPAVRTLAHGPLRVFARSFASKNLPDHIVVKFPSLSPTMTVGTLQRWNVKVGDKVSAGDSLGEVETDKAVMSFDSTEDGYIAKLLVADGASEIPLGKPVLVLVENEGDVAKFADFAPEEGGAAKAAPAPAAKPAAAPAPAPAPAAAPAAPAAAPAASQEGSPRVFGSPLAKRTAEAANVNLASIGSGSGTRGRIIKADVDAFVANQASTPASAPAPAASAPAPTSTTSTGLFKDLPLSNVRKVIAARLLESKTTVPHYYLSIDVQVDKALALRKDFNDAGKGELKLSMNDFVIKAAALSLRKVPEVNSSWMSTFIRQFENVDISVAVSTPTGLITPIVFDADYKGLGEISGDVKALAAKAKENKLKPEEFQGGTFTISNLGMFGVKSFSAIINPPQACILAVGATEEQVVVDASSANGFRVANVMNVTLSCDHRVVDGAVGAQWLKHFKGFLENPTTMLL